MQNSKVMTAFRLSPILIRTIDKVIVVSKHKNRTEFIEDACSHYLRGIIEFYYHDKKSGGLHGNKQ